MTESAVYESFVGVELTLTDGTVVTAKPCMVSQAPRFLQALDKIADGAEDAGDALMLLHREFPAAIGLEHEIDDHVHPADLLRVASDFFSALWSVQRRGNGTDPAPSPQGKTEQKTPPAIAATG